MQCNRRRAPEFDPCRPTHAVAQVDARSVPTFRGLCLATLLLGGRGAAAQTFAASPPRPAARFFGPAERVPFATYPLTGCAATLYTARLDIFDSPALDVIVDVGSSDLVVAANNCPSCVGIAPSFPLGGAGFTNSTGSVHYAFAAAHGSIYRRDIIVPHVSPVRLSLLAIEMQHRLFPSQACYLNLPGLQTAQGILGLGPNTGAQIDSVSLIGALAKAGSSPTFALQLCDFGGFLWIGGYDTRATLGALAYTPLISGTRHYTVDLRSLDVDAVALAPAPGENHFIIDNGANRFVLPPQLRQQLVAHLDPAMRTLFKVPDYFAHETCHTHALSRVAIDTLLPTLTLRLANWGAGDNLSLRLPPSRSYLQVSYTTDGRLFYCPGLLSGATVLDFHGGIISANLMTKHTLVFEPENHRLGFALQNASMCQPIRGLGAAGHHPVGPTSAGALRARVPLTAAAWASLLVTPWLLYPML